MLTFSFTGVEGTMTQEEILTSGMVGKQVQFLFSPEWEGMYKTAVYSAGKRCVIHAGIGALDTIPAEVLEIPMERLYVGIYAMSEDGSRAIPTLRAEGPMIRPGANPAWDSAADPELPVWAQLQTMIGQISDLETQAQGNLVAAINELAQNCLEEGAAGGNGATFFPAVSQNGVLSWSNDQGLENPEPVCLMGAEGPAGMDGLSIYTTGENAPVEETAGAQTEFSLEEIVVPDGRSLSDGDLLIMESGSLLFRITAVDESAGIVTAGYLVSMKGAAGQKGDTPVRGTDYWTEADKAEIKAYVDDAILGGAW